ncbi:MAG TPA: ABC transporter substrate-binding protein [Stellaceae bacterium]|nr:ABC transporter substrate-binding protein [Stellaceae bacterium]
MRRIGVLMGYPEGDIQAQANVVALREGLERVGWKEGRNIRIDFRWAGADPVAARTFAKQLIELKPDVIIPSTNQVTAILQQETRTIPIVFAFVGDPIGSGFAASLSRPGGNLTGFANFENSVGAKWLQVLTEIAPKVRRVGFIFDPDAAPNVGFMHAAEGAAPTFKIEFTALAVRNGADIERVITNFAAAQQGGLIVAPHAVTLGNRDLIAALAAKHRLPAVYGDRYFAESGGLASFGNNAPDLFRRAAAYIDLILKGANPADLPVQLPTKFEFIINMKTAKALGLDMPESVLAGADEVIE